MFCENCKRRPATMKMTVQKADGEAHQLMLCGMCAYRFTNVLQPPVSGSAYHDAAPSPMDQRHFPTQRHGAFMGFSTSTQEAIRGAEASARSIGLAYVGTVPLLIGVMSLKHPVTGILERNGVKLPDLLNAANPEGRPPVLPEGEEPAMSLSQDALSVLKMAQHQARGSQDDFVEPQHVVLGMIMLDKVTAAKWMKSKQINFAQLEADLTESLRQERPATAVTEMSPAEMLLGTGTEADARQAPAESALAKYSRDLTAMAEKDELMPVVGRDAELGRVIMILSRLQKNNPLLLGEAGVGKTAVVEALAQHIIDDDVPRRLRGCRLYQIDLTSIVAGTEMRGAFEKRMQELLGEVKAKGPGTLLFVDEIHTMVGAGASEGSMDAGNIMKPALARGELHLIGATTLAEYHKYIEKDPALARRFQPVLVGEPTVEQATGILEGIKGKFEQHSGAQVSDDAITAAVTLSNQYITDRFLPDKAIDLMDEACSMVAIENDEKGEKRAVIADDVAKVLSSWTGIPLTKMVEKDKQRLLDMEDYLHRRLVDQEEAVKAVSDVVRRSRAGLKDPNKPNGAFVFAGPTGVGKTELARTLAEFLFNGDNALIRIDMSEYMEPESVSRLIGAPPGYVGYEQGGQLTEKVKFKPYSVVLFDEMEKANAKVLNLLLQIADAGRLTDGQGKEVDFKNTIIILTTNLGSDLWLAPAPDREAIRSQLVDLMASATSPELVNRMDSVILFNPLTEEQIKSIIGLQVGYLGNRLAAQKVKLEIGPDAVDYLARKGYDPAFGARPARRVIQQELESPLSEMLLGGTLGAGGTVKVAVKDDHLDIGTS